MFVHGRPFWAQFAVIQRNQSGQFDQWTIKEHFNRILTPEQLNTLVTSEEATKVTRIRKFTERLQREKTPHLGLSDEDRAIVRDDVIKSVRARNDLSDVEKQQVIDDINYTYDNNDFFITSPARRVAPSDEAVKVAEIMGIPAELLDSDAASTRTHTFFDPLIPIPSRLFGWQRTDKRESSGVSSKTSSGYTKVKGGRDELPGRDLGKMVRRRDFDETHPDAIADEKRLLKQSIKYFGSLSQREIDAATEYIESSSAINYFLRFGKMPQGGPGLRPVPSQTEIVRRAEELTDILENSPPLTQPVVLYRGLGDIDIDDYDQLIRLGVGGEFSDDGIVSTSTSPEMASSFVGRTGDDYDIPLLEIIVPKGGRALSLVSRKDSLQKDFPEYLQDGYDVEEDDEFRPVVGELFGEPIIGSYEKEGNPKSKIILEVIP
jgi:hypothetical protein